MQIIKGEDNSIQFYPFKDNDMSVVIYKHNGQKKVAWDKNFETMPLDEAKVFNQTISLAITMAETGIID